MSATKLILLEGIPGSGKSTAGEYLECFLKKAGFPVRFWREGDFDNPADFEGVACLNTTQYRNLVLRHLDVVELLEGQLTVRGGDHFLKYRKLQQLYPERISLKLVTELSGFDVYDGLPMDDYGRLALQRWKEFARSAELSEEITILECCFLQNPLTVMFARHNADPQYVREHVMKLSGILEPLNPLLIYLQPCDVRAALQHVRSERPREWADFVTWYLTGQAYGKAHHLYGYEGVIQFYEMRQKFEMELLRDLSLRSLVAEHTEKEWEYCYRQVMAFVSPYLRA